MFTCNCKIYEDLEMTRKVITKRIKDRKQLKKSLAELCLSSDKEHKYLKCEECGQHWQMSRAWNWGNEAYMFKVPAIPVNDWLELPFVQPDKLLIFVACVSDFIKKSNQLDDTVCKVEGCKEYVLLNTVFCIKHQMQSLQRQNRFPSFPEGRWFGPYLRENFEPTFNNAM